MSNTSAASLCKKVLSAILKESADSYRRTVSGRRFQSRGAVKKNDFSPNLELAAVTTRSSRVDDLSQTIVLFLSRMCQDVIDLYFHSQWTITHRLIVCIHLSLPLPPPSASPIQPENCYLQETCYIHFILWIFSSNLK